MEYKTIYTAIFGSYDTLKDPTVVTSCWKYICFTDQDLKSDIWEIRRVPLIDNNPQLTARSYKINFHHHINSQYSMWIDGSFQINCNLNEWWEDKFKAPITCIAHPFRNCIYEEALVCVQQKRGNVDDIQKQIESYKEIGLPKNNGLIQSGILMREKTAGVRNLCELWYEQIRKYSIRDQIAFSCVTWLHNIKYKLVVNWKYGRDKEFIFTKHIKK